MSRSHTRWISLGLLLLSIVTLTACEATSSDKALDEPVAPEPSDLSESSQQETICYYINKLPDRDYVQTYGDAENPRPWYTAAEALGEIGKPAIPALIERLDSQDPYELKLALYALMLASQDPALQAETDGDYLQLGTVLTEDGNTKNRQLALEWWERYQHLWQ